MSTDSNLEDPFVGNGDFDYLCQLVLTFGLDYDWTENYKGFI